MYGQAGVTSVLTGWTGDCGVVVVEILGTGAPSLLEEPLGSVASDTLDLSCDAG